MERLLARSWLLALLWAGLLSVASAGKADAPTGGRGALASAAGNRVIVRYADPRGERAEGELLEQKLRELRVKPGVREAKALVHVGMAVVACESIEAQEELLRGLEADPQVELATPDTEVRFHEEAPAFGRTSGSERPLEDLRRCSAQSGCSALGLVGNCCPATDGLMLACCDGPTTENLVSFRSFHGKYMVAEKSGEVNANRDKVGEWEQFQLFYNDDKTVSLRSHFGKYVSAGKFGDVDAKSSLIGNSEKFKLIRNKDQTVSLRSSYGKYFAAEEHGALHANRNNISDWEKFAMSSVGGPSQRLPNDANFSALWGMNDPRDEDIDAPEAWKKFTGEFSAGIVVAVIDTGIDYTHEDLRENMWTNPNEIPGNGIDDDGNGYIDDVHGADFANEDGDPMDDQMHGTHCAGTIAGVGNNGLGVAGVAWRGVRLMALKFLSASGGGRTSDAIRAIDYAVAHGAKVASNSWGGGGSNAALRVAIDRAEAAGVLFVAAAGNSGSNNDEQPNYPSNYPASSIVAVASTTVKGELSSFSCYGTSTVDLAAPGSNIFSTVPHQRYKSLSGTSMATPHVSGLAALIWMYRPSLSMMQVKELLMSTVDHLDSLEGKVFTGGRINARKAIDAASAVEPPYPPRHGPQAIKFQDTDPKIGLIGGTVTITAARDESDVEYYKVYWVSRAGFQLDVVGNVSATGAKVLEVALGGSVVMPQYAAGLVAVAGNATGERPAQIGSGAPNVAVEDFGMPEQGPQAVHWLGDVDLKKGTVAGKLSVVRAVDERSVSKYNIYWSNATGQRGPKVGSIQSIGFFKPACAGLSCSLIAQTNISGGVRYAREDYGNDEQATIRASGPGLITVTRFDTESYYDTLVVGSRELSGTPSLPMDIKLPEGPVSISWFSDKSITASGWSFDLVQTGETVDFHIASTALPARGLEVVPAYGENEMPSGVFVEVVDYTSKMPPSPGFAPAAVRFTDVNMTKGVVAGTATVMPAAGASANGSVSYYQLDFADAEGLPVGRGRRADANGSKPVLLPVEATRLPAGVSKILVRPGNAYGLGSGQILVDIVDEFSRPVVNLSVAGASHGPLHLLQAAGEADQGKAKESQRELAAEPWLRQPSPSEAQRVVWPPRSAATLAAARSVRSSILGAVTIAGLDAHAAASPKLHSALARALASGLPHARDEDIKVVRVLAAVGSSSTTRSRPAQSKAGRTTTVEFEISSPPGAPRNALDRIESRLIVLSRGGPSAERFDGALLEKLAHAGSSLPAGTRTRIREPQQIVPKRHGRSLGAAVALGEEQQATSAVALGEEQQAIERLDDLDANVFHATVAAALAVTLAALIIVVLTRQWYKQAAARSEGKEAALEGVQVHRDGELQTSVATSHREWVVLRGQP